MHAGFPFLLLSPKNEKMETSQDARSEREDNLHSIISKITDATEDISESGLVSDDHSRSFARFFMISFFELNFCLHVESQRCLVIDVIIFEEFYSFYMYAYELLTELLTATNCYMSNSASNLQ